MLYRNEREAIAVQQKIAILFNTTE
ncbi:uncharacterized protein METZ01_LOCUS400890, partial [marine metagenome]